VCDLPSDTQTHARTQHDVFQSLLPVGKKSKLRISGFVGLEIAWPLVPKFAGSHPAEAVGFLGRKSPQHTFLRRGSTAVGPMS